MQWSESCARILYFSYVIQCKYWSGELQLLTTTLFVNKIYPAVKSHVGSLHSVRDRDKNIKHKLRTITPKM